jgi:hypothetical protein
MLSGVTSDTLSLAMRTPVSTSIFLRSTSSTLALMTRPRIFRLLLCRRKSSILACSQDRQGGLRCCTCKPGRAPGACAHLLVREGRSGAPRALLQHGREPLPLIWISHETVSDARRVEPAVGRDEAASLLRQVDE